MRHYRRAIAHQFGIIVGLDGNIHEDPYLHHSCAPAVVSPHPYPGKSVRAGRPAAIILELPPYPLAGDWRTHPCGRRCDILQSVLLNRRCFTAPYFSARTVAAAPPKGHSSAGSLSLSILRRSGFDRPFVAPCDFPYSPEKHHRAPEVGATLIRCRLYEPESADLSTRSNFRRNVRTGDRRTVRITTQSHVEEDFPSRQLFHTVVIIRIVWGHS